MMLREALEEEGYGVEAVGGGRAGVERVQQGGVDLVISDVKMPDLDGLDMLREIKAVTPSPHVITITAFGSIDTAIRAVKLGAFDYITKPFDVDQLILSVQKALDERALRSELARLRDEVQRSYRWGNIIGKSAAMQAMFALIRRLSRLGGVGAGDGRVGDRQGAGRQVASLQQPAPRAAVRGRSTAPPSRTRCWRASCSATSAARSPTRAPIAPVFHRGGRRHDLPRRDRRAVAGAAGEAPARAAGGRGSPAGRGAQPEGRRARDRRDQQGSGREPGERRVPRRTSSTG